MTKKHVYVAVGIIFDASKEKVLIAQRQRGQHLAGKWEFPGGKIDPGEENTEALIRELHEELGIDVNVPEFLFDIDFEYPEKCVTLHIFRVEDFKNAPVGCEGQVLQWVHLNALEHIDFPEANSQIVRYLLDL